MLSALGLPTLRRWPSCGARTYDCVMAIASLTAINIFPVKSLGGVPASEADVEPWGLRHDRRWLVLTASSPSGQVSSASASAWAPRR